MKLRKNAHHSETRNIKRVPKKNVTLVNTTPVTTVKTVDISSVFGMLKGKRTMTGQEAKDLARSGWEKKKTFRL